MKAIQIKQDIKDSPEALYIADDVPEPVLKNGEIMINVKAFGLNRMDLMQRRGQYPLPPGASEIMGVEFAGTVDSDSDTDFKKGDEVFGLVSGGCYAEKVAVRKELLWKKPASLDWVHAAAIPEQWLTAFQTSIVIGQLKKGDSILVHAGASGVGTSAIQLARKNGAAKIFTTAGTAEKCKFLTEHLGATKAFNYKQDDWAEGVLKETDGKGVDVILDFIGASYFANNLKAAARDARLVLIGLMGGAVLPDGSSIGPLLFKRIRMEGTTLRSRSLEYQANLMNRFEKEALPLIVGRKQGSHDKEAGLDLIIHAVYDAKDIVKATQEMESNASTGKIICTW